MSEGITVPRFSADYGPLVSFIRMLQVSGLLSKENARTFEFDASMIEGGVYLVSDSPVEWRTVLQPTTEAVEAAASVLIQQEDVVHEGCKAILSHINENCIKASPAPRDEK